MKKTTEKIYELVQKELLNHPEQKGVETKFIAEQLHLQRTNVSSLLNQLCNEGKLVKGTNRPVLYSLPVDGSSSDKNSFSSLIGYDGSLQNAVQLAKAAILYPPKSLPTLIEAPHGCGTDALVNLMYEYAKQTKVLKEDAPFVKISCVNYEEDSKALHEALFGEGQNAFMQATDGILFLDDVEYVNADDKERLNQYIEAVNSKDIMNNNHSVFLILGSSKNRLQRDDRMKLLEKIPIRIELPPLSKRPLEERYELINRFFSIESARAKRKIETSSEVMRMLLLYDCPLNVKQINLDIKIACATAYARNFEDAKSTMTLFADDFELYVRKGLLAYKQNMETIDALVKTDSTFVFDEDSAVKKYSNFKLSGNGYTRIHSQIKELEERGLASSEASSIVSKTLREEITRYKRKLSNQVINTEQLKLLVDQKIIDSVAAFMKACEERFQKQYQPSVFYGLCLHISSLTQRKKHTERISSEQVTKIIKTYSKEFTAAQEFANTLQKTMNLDLNVDEIVLITMFLTDDEAEEEGAKPQLLVTMHGNSTADSIADVIQTLTRTNNIHSFNLSLSSNAQDSMEELEQLVKSIDQGKGIIAIYDMGSLKTMLETISTETGIPIRLVNMPVTLIGLDIARKCAVTDDVDTVYHSVVSELSRYRPESTIKPCVFITLCNTGEGGAVQLAEYIQKYSNLGYSTIPLSISDRKQLIRKVSEIRKANKVAAFVGTYDPKMFGIPYISVQQIFECPKENLDFVLEQHPVNSEVDAEEQMYKQFDEDLTVIPKGKLKEVLPDVIQEFDVKYGLNEDQRIGMSMHLAAMLARLLEKKSISKNPNTEKIIKEHAKEFHTMAKCLQPLEKKFNVVIPDSEVANVYEIIKG